MQLESSEKKPIKHWTAVHVYHAAQHTVGHVALLQHPAIDPGQNGLVQLVTQDPLTLCLGDRVIMRDQGATRTLGYGVVLDPLAISKGRAKPERIAFLEGLRDAQSDNEAAKVLISQKAGGVPTALLTRMLNWRPEQITAFSAEDAEILRVEDLLVLSSAFQGVAQQLMQNLKDWHDAHPNEKGLNKAQLANHLPKDCLYGESLLSLLKTQNKIELVELTKTINNGQSFTVQEYRDAAGIGRNLCIELLEHFDHQGLTRRDGNQRFPKS